MSNPEECGECLGDATDPREPRRRAWQPASHHDEVVYELGDYSATQRTDAPATPIPADREAAEFDARALACGWSAEERAWRLKAEQRLAAMLREINGGYGI